MAPRIEEIKTKKLIGHSLPMTLAANRTAELWSGFMPRRKEIQQKLSNDFFSVQVYNPEISFSDFNPQTEFVKWAAVEVPEEVQIPNGMKALILEGGLYAVFIHKGLVSDFPKTMSFIFSQWLPKSGYSLDSRPHFELLGEKYKNNDPSSEEEVWIPIREG